MRSSTLACSFVVGQIKLVGCKLQNIALLQIQKLKIQKQVKSTATILKLLMHQLAIILWHRNPESCITFNKCRFCLSPSRKSKIKM